MKNGRPPLVCIDARRKAAGYQLWGMNIVERQVREMALHDVQRFKIWVSPSSAGDVGNWRRDLHRLYLLELVVVEVATLADLTRDLGHLEDDIILLEGDVVYDDRVLSYLLKTGPGCRVIGCNAEGAAYLAAGQLEQIARDIDSVCDETSAAIEEPLTLPGEDLKAIYSRDIGHYVPELRLTMEPIMVRVLSPADLAPLGRRIYRRTFKGVIDVVARYGYYHLVRFITYPLSFTSIPPNLLTAISILGIWGAIPCFATGHMAAGFSAAWAGVLLDSIDGKLARLRLHLSDRMGAFEHIAAAPGLALWYAALGWYLSATDSAASGDELPWTLAGIGAFALDKVVSGGFKRMFGKEIFDYSATDARFHLIAARRNITLSIFTLGAIAGNPGLAFRMAVVWMVITFGYHLVRLIQVATGKANRSRR